MGTATVGTSATPQPPVPANIDYESIDSPYGSYSTAALNSPVVDGVDIGLNWSEVEPSQGQFNFAPLDQAMAAWGGANKWFTLVIRFLDEPSPIAKYSGCAGLRQFLPAWEIARIPTYCDGPEGIILPDYFDTTFESDVQAFVQAIAQHVQSSPYRERLLYVRIGLGMGGESFPLLRCQGTCGFQNAMAQLVAWGFSPVAWETWQKQMLTGYQKAFSYATIIYPLNSGWGKDPQTGRDITIEVAQWAAARGFGLGQQGLQPTPSYVTSMQHIFGPLRAQYPNLLIQFQTVYLVPDAATVQGDVSAAEQIGARTIEWYTRNLLNPAYQPYITQWHTYQSTHMAAP